MHQLVHSFAGLAQGFSHGISHFNVGRPMPMMSSDQPMLSARASLSCAELNEGRAQVFATDDDHATIPAVVLNDTRVDMHHGCDRVMQHLGNLASCHGIRITAMAPAHLDWRRNPQLMAALDKARLIIVNAEGTIHHDRPAGSALLAVGKEAKARGIPSALINCTWQSNGAPFVEMLRHFSLVSVRESYSEREVKAQGIDCLRVPDLSLYGACLVSSRRKGIGYTDSVLRAQSAALFKLGRRLSATPCPIQYPEKGLLGSWRYFRQYMGKDDLRSIPDGFLRLASRYADWHARMDSHQRYLARISNLQLLITGRFHSACLALAARTPILVADSNSHKSRALIEDAGLETWRFFDPASVDGSLIEKARQWTPNEACNLDDYLSDAQRRLNAMWIHLRSLAD